MELLKGTVDVLILRTLVLQPTHGYGISEWIRDRTGGVLELQDAALYQALHRLEQKGWVEAEWGLSENNRRARFYALTDAGKARLKQETSEWKSYVEAVFRVLEPGQGEAR